MVTLFGNNRTGRFLTGRVTVSAPGVGVPSGQIVFTRDGFRSRRLQLVDGEATIRVRLVRGLAQSDLGLIYMGDADTAPSTATKVLRARVRFVGR